MFATHELLKETKKAIIAMKKEKDYNDTSNEL